MTYEEALAYIHSITWRGSRPGLSRTAELCEKLGSPEKELKFLHVTGTNGKGSVCAMCDSVLRKAGYRVGLYTSPYIVRFNERMRIDGEPISDIELAALTAEVKPAAESMADPPTEFELITAIAFLYFKRHNCDIVVLEVGMGGRLDSTNVIESPAVSVITGIALEHTEVLGDTVEKIAFEKAGIIKERRPAVYGGRDEAAFAVVKARAEELNSALVRTDIAAIKIKSETPEGTRFDYGKYKDLKLSLCGSYQPENAAAAVEALALLKKQGLKITKKALYEGLAEAKWPARFELLARRPYVVFDGSHNVQGVTAAVESVKALLGGKAVLLAGVLADKKYGEMAALLATVASKVFCVTPPSPRALGSADFAKVFSEIGTEAIPFGDIPSGVEAAYAEAKKTGLPLVMLGSLYMYGDVLKAFTSLKP